MHLVIELLYVHQPAFVTHRGGGGCFGVLNKGISGLWSVSMMNWDPIRYIYHLLHAHLTASASRSICKYLVSVSVSDLLMHATGCHSLVPFCWNRMRPSPLEPATTVTLVGSLVS